MNHGDYAIERVLSGDYVFTAKRRAIGAVLRGAQGPLKEDHLNHLSGPFNLIIWNHVITALPDNDARDAAAKSKRSKLSAEMAALYEAHHNGQLSAKDYTAQSNVLMEHYNAVARQTDQIHKQYVDRLMAHITNAVQSKCTSLAVTTFFDTTSRCQVTR